MSMAVPAAGREAWASFPLSTSREGQAFASTVASDFWPPQLWENAFLCVKPPRFVEMCYSSQRKLIQAQERDGA